MIPVDTAVSGSRLLIYLVRNMVRSANVARCVLSYKVSDSLGSTSRSCVSLDSVLQKFWFKFSEDRLTAWSTALVDVLLLRSHLKSKPAGWDQSPSAAFSESNKCAGDNSLCTTGNHVTTVSGADLHWLKDF